MPASPVTAAPPLSATIEPELPVVAALLVVVLFVAVLFVVVLFVVVLLVVLLVVVLLTLVFVVAFAEPSLFTNRPVTGSRWGSLRMLLAADWSPPEFETLLPLEEPEPPFETEPLFETELPLEVFEPLPAAEPRGVVPDAVGERRRGEDVDAFPPDADLGLSTASDSVAQRVGARRLRPQTRALWRTRLHQPRRGRDVGRGA